jgi:hippurate hydrolase
MTQNEPTALYVDLSGKGEQSGHPKSIAFRADMDALSMVEANHELPYRSKIEGKAHMCGHDGHMTCLVAFASIFLSKAQ